MIVARLLRSLARAVRSARIWLWARRAQIVFAREGYEIEISLGPDVSFHTLPTIEVTRQPPDRGGGSSRRARLRIEAGPLVHLGRDLTLEIVPWEDNHLVLAEGVSCGTGVRLMLFGGELRVGDWSRLRDGVTLKSSGQLEIGEYAIVQNGTLIHCSESVTIADRVTFGERVSVLDSDHLADGSDTWVQDQPLGVDPVVIERNAWLGTNAVVLRGVHLGRNAVVAAGSVVRAGEYPAGWLIAGAPAEAKKALPAAPGAADRSATA